MAISYDSKCFELAEHFLPEHPAQRRQLAAHIQEAIEDWLESNIAPRVEDVSRK